MSKRRRSIRNNKIQQSIIIKIRGNKTTSRLTKGLIQLIHIKKRSITPRYFIKYKDIILNREIILFFSSEKLKRYSNSKKNTNKNNEYQKRSFIHINHPSLSEYINKKNIF